MFGPEWTVDTEKILSQGQETGFCFHDDELNWHFNGRLDVALFVKKFDLDLSKNHDETFVDETGKVVKDEIYEKITTRGGFITDPIDKLKEKKYTVSQENLKLDARRIDKKSLELRVQILRFCEKGLGLKKCELCRATDDLLIFAEIIPEDFNTPYFLKFALPGWFFPGLSQEQFTPKKEKIAFPLSYVNLSQLTSKSLRLKILGFASWFKYPKITVNRVVSIPDNWQKDIVKFHYAKTDQQVQFGNIPTKKERELVYREFYELALHENATVGL